MIQRIQSVFLLLVSLLSIVLFFLPVFLIKTTSGDINYMITSNMLTSLAVAISGLIAFISIFLYRNRQRQLMLNRLNILFIIGAIGLIFQASDSSASSVFGQTVIEYLYPVYFPLVQIVLTLLALRFIRKDEELVRSADRLR